MGRVSGALRRAGHPDAATEYSEAVTRCGSYDEVLRLTMSTVDVQ
jgi:hypothetical protein